VGQPETHDRTVAKLRLADERAEIERLRQTAADVTAGDAAMGALVSLYRQRVDDRVDIRPDIRRRLFEEIDAIIKTWSGLEGLHRGNRRGGPSWNGGTTKMV